MTAARVIKMCDMPIEVALKVFTMLNSGKVRVTDSRVIGNRFLSLLTKSQKTWCSQKAGTMPRVLSETSIRVPQVCTKKL